MLFPAQVGFKAMAYVMLHGEATLDLLEIAPRELQFRQVPGAAGDFLQLQGKFMLASDDPPPEVKTSCVNQLQLQQQQRCSVHVLLLPNVSTTCCISMLYSRATTDAAC